MQQREIIQKYGGGGSGGCGDGKYTTNVTTTTI